MCDLGAQGQFYGNRNKESVVFIAHLNLCAKLPTTLSTSFPAVSQCGLEGNVTHLNICLNQMEYRKEINLLPAIK